MKPIEQRLQETEEKLTHLEARQDQIATNAFSIGPHGEVNETLTGFLEAHGIQLVDGVIALNQGAGNGDAIQWKEGEQVREEIIGTNNAGEHELLLRAFPEDPAAQLLMRSDSEGNAALLAGSADFAIREDGERSSFPRTTGAPRKTLIEFGIGKCFFNAGSETSLNYAIPLSGEAGENAYYFATAIVPPGVACYANIINPTLKGAEVFLKSTYPEGGPGPGNIPIYWLAILEG